jgi:hypothetical protein
LWWTKSFKAIDQLTIIQQVWKVSI